MKLHWLLKHSLFVNTSTTETEVHHMIITKNILFSSAEDLERYIKALNNIRLTTKLEIDTVEISLP